MDATFTTPYLLVSDPQALTVLHADRDDDDRRALDRVEGAEAVLWAEAELPMRAEGCRQGEQLAVTRLPRRLVSQRRPESPQDDCMIPLRQYTNTLTEISACPFRRLEGLDVHPLARSALAPECNLIGVGRSPTHRPRCECPQASRARPP